MNGGHDIPPIGICVSAADTEFLAHLLNPATSQIVSMQTADCDQTLDAHLDAVTTDHGVIVLECRHIGERCIPRGPTWTVPLADVVYLHVW